ncbi:MAG: hypothetical protein RJA22_1091 [Verrucomicrobiota bacterium]
MNSERPSFDAGRRWSHLLQVGLNVLAVLALVVMANYLAARHQARFSWAGQADSLSERSRQVLRGVTNDVRVVLYFDRQHPLFQMTHAMLRSYAEANPRVTVDLIDPERDPAAAQAAKLQFKLREREDRDLVIFECQGRTRFIYQGELSDLDLNELMAGRSGEVRRVAFKGEMLFTSALLTVITPRQLKAYFLQGHGEHLPDSDDGLAGYARFAALLRENSIQHETLRLDGAAEIPADCSLLIIPGPRMRFAEDELARIDRYLQQGGRLLALFNNAAVTLDLGLEGLLERWGVTVGRNLVFDEPHAVNLNKLDLRISTFGTHPVVKPILTGGLYLVLPRSISRRPDSARGSGDPKVDELAYTTQTGHAITDIRPDGRWSRRPDDLTGQIPLMVAVERGGIPNVSAGRGSSRLLIVGESIFLANSAIQTAANLEFASHAVNWLVARDELLLAIPPRPIREYKLTMTQRQLRAVEWSLLAGLPGVVLLAGAAVWLKRRR